MEEYSFKTNELLDERDVRPNNHVGTYLSMNDMMLILKKDRLTRGQRRTLLNGVKTMSHRQQRIKNFLKEIKGKILIFFPNELIKDATRTTNRILSKMLKKDSRIYLTKKQMTLTFCAILHNMLKQRQVHVEPSKMLKIAHVVMEKKSRITFMDIVKREKELIQQGWLDEQSPVSVTNTLILKIKKNLSYLLQENVLSREIVVEIAGELKNLVERGLFPHVSSDEAARIMIISLSKDIPLAKDKIDDMLRLFNTREEDFNLFRARFLKKVYKFRYRLKKAVLAAI